MTWLIFSVAFADCPLDLAGLQTYLDSAEQAFRDHDVETFQKVAEAVSLDLPCLSEPVTPGLAARVHRLQGLVRFINDQNEGATQCFAACRSAGGDELTLQGLLPSAHTAHELFERMSPETIERESVPAPRTGALSFDGTLCNERPRSVPTVMQVFDDNGVVLVTGVLQTTDPLLPYEPVRTRKKGPNVKLLATAGGLAAASGAMWGAASMSRARFMSEDGTQGYLKSDLEAHQSRTNTLATASLVTAGLALTGTGLAFAWDF